MSNPAMQVEVPGTNSDAKITFTVETAGAGTVHVRLEDPSGVAQGSWDADQCADLTPAVLSIGRVAKAAGELAQ